MARRFGVLKKEQDKQLRSLNPEAEMDNALGDWPHHYAPEPIGRPKSSSPAQVWLSALIVIAALGLVVYSCAARAHDYAHPENQQWYESLKNADNTPCCDGKDANHIADIDWDTSCELNNFGERLCHYRVFLHNRWWNVPAQAVVNGPNRDGSALVWEVPTRDGDKVVSTSIRCFMPGAGG
jgi:hypothetical protein